jgi:hypothetical protein
MMDKPSSTIIFEGTLQKDIQNGEVIVLGVLLYRPKEEQLNVETPIGRANETLAMLHKFGIHMQKELCGFSAR